MFALQAKPVNAPLADEKIAPSHCSLRAEDRSDSHREQVGADRCAGLDAQKEFGNQGEKVRMGILIVQMISDGGGMKDLGLNGCSCVRTREHVGGLLVWSPAQWACIQVVTATFGEL